VRTVHRPGVDPCVDQVHRAAGDPDAVGQGVPHGVGAGEGWQQGRVGVEHGGAPQGGGAEDLHEAGADDEATARTLRQVCGEVPGEGIVPGGPVRVVGHGTDEAGYAGGLGSGERPSARPVRADRDDAGAVAGGGLRVDERLQVAPGTGDEHDDGQGSAHVQGA
jgi:hypothetical protein